MKNLIKELAKREGLKSQVKIGDLREAVSKLQDMIAEECVNNMIVDLENQPAPFPPFTADFCIALQKKCNALLKKKKRNERFTGVSFDNNISVTPKIKSKKKAKK